MVRHRAEGKRVFASTQDDLSVNKIERAPRVNYRIVPCLECGVEIGDFCISSNGNVMRRVHISRKRIATRKMLEEKKEEG